MNLQRLIDRLVEFRDDAELGPDVTVDLDVDDRVVDIDHFRIMVNRQGEPYALRLS